MRYRFAFCVLRFVSKPVIPLEKSKNLLVDHWHIAGIKAAQANFHHEQEGVARMILPWRARLPKIHSPRISESILAWRPRPRRLTRFATTTHIAEHHTDRPSTVLSDWCAHWSPATIQWAPTKNLQEPLSIKHSESIVSVEKIDSGASGKLSIGRP